MLNFAISTQKALNIQYFKDGAEMAPKREFVQTLIEHCKEITWAIGCSGSLFFQGAWPEMNDFDIFVSLDSLDNFLNIFENLGGIIIDDPHQEEKKNFFASTFFTPAKLGDIPCDLVCEYTVKGFGKEYRFSLTKENIVHIPYHDTTIPVTPMEANMLLYGMMIDWQGHRQDKYFRTIEYLKEIGITKPNIFDDVDMLPTFIRDDINSL